MPAARWKVSPVPLALRRPAGAVLVLLIAGAAACVVDLGRPASRQWSTRAALAGIDFYQQTISTHLPRFGVRCRFTPTCSRYTKEMVRRHGVARAAWPSMRRLVRCGPWTAAGTVDLPQ